MAFDPDAYLAESFDPDAYLAEDAPAAPPQAPASRGPLLDLADRIDAAGPSLRSLAPGLYATFNRSSPEAVAEGENMEELRRSLGKGGGTPDLVAAAEAFDRTPMAALMFAPTGTPQAPITTVKPPRLTKIPAARKLEAEGVKDLTAGQMAPGSLVGTLERASADHPFGLAPQRKAATESFMRVAQDKGVAPGASPPKALDLQDRLKEILDGFDPAYAPIKGKQVPSQALDNLPDAAVMPGRGVDARTALGVKKEIENALSVLGPKPQPPAPSGLLGPNGQPLPAPPAPPMKATAGDLLKVRENIREQSRAARQAQDFDRLRLLDDAEDVVTEALEKALSPQEAAALQATDRQYARAMTAANAAPAGQTNFTPGQYLRQVERSAGRRAFKKGDAGDLQDLGEAAREVFADMPMTGLRPGVLSGIPAAKYWGAPVARLANSEWGKKFLFGPRTSTSTPRPPETFMGVPGEAVAASADLRALADFLRSKGLDVRWPQGAMGDEEGGP